MKRNNLNTQKHNSTTCTRLRDVPDFLKGKDITGAFVYHAGDQQLWHTNWISPNARCYLVHSETGDSGMRFIVNGEVKTYYDPVGWSYRIFNVPQPHCVFSNCLRYSYGWRLPTVPSNKQNLNSKMLDHAEAILQIT